MSRPSPHEGNVLRIGGMKGLRRGFDANGRNGLHVPAVERGDGSEWRHQRRVRGCIPRRGEVIV